MKRPVLVLIVVMLAGTAAFADHEGMGIGVVGGGALSSNNIHYGNVGLSLKVPNFPIFWGIYPIFYGHGLGLGVTGDYYFLDNDLVTDQFTNEDGTYNFNLDWFLGVGAFVNMHFWDGGMAVNFGARVPVGLSWHIIRQLEMFLDIAPGIGVYFGPGGPDLYFAGAFEFGLRYWINN